MAINPLTASVPATPVVDSSGAATAVWRGFFLALQARTGHASGVSASDMSARVTAELAAQNVTIAQIGAALSAETVARQAADALEEITRAAADQVFAEKISDGGPTADAERLARLAGDAQSRGFAFFVGVG